MAAIPGGEDLTCTRVQLLKNVKSGLRPDTGFRDQDEQDSQVCGKTVKSMAIQSTAPILLPGQISGR